MRKEDIQVDVLFVLVCQYQVFVVDTRLSTHVLEQRSRWVEGGTTRGRYVL